MYESCITAFTTHVSLEHRLIALQHILKIKLDSSTLFRAPTFLGPGETHTYQFGGLYSGGRPDVPCQPHTITILVLIDEIRPSRHHRLVLFRDGRNLWDSRMTKLLLRDCAHAIARCALIRYVTSP